ncbi:MAG: hemolysin family protein [Gammaproteobacteria bacterium]
MESIVSLFADPPRLLQLDMLLRIVVQIALFFCSALFSGSETALFSLTRYDLQRLSRKRHPQSDKLQALLEQPRRLIVSILCGNELVNIAAAANMTAILVELFGVQTASWMAAVVMVPLILLLGEVTPKTLAVINPVWASTRIVATPLSWWVKVIRPVAFIVRSVADWTTTRLIGPERVKEDILQVEEIQTLIDEGVESGEFTATDKSLVSNLIQASTKRVDEIMTHRSRVKFIDGSQSREDIRTQVARQRHPRVPVYRNNLDNVIGFLHVEDVLDWDPEQLETLGLEQFLHPVHAVPGTRMIDEMLDFFQEHDIQAALVVSEFGTIEGLVTLSDITRYMCTGLFQAESPQSEVLYTEEGRYEFDGWMPISQFRRLLGLGVGEPNMTTVGGFVLRHLGRMPREGESFTIENMQITVLKMAGLQIARLQVEPLGQAPIQKQGVSA